MFPVSSTAVQAIDMAEESPDKAPAAAAETAQPPTADEAAPAAKKPPKKEKPPALEDKPFADFIQQDYLPALKQALATNGISDLQIALERAKIPVIGFENAPECSQVIGHWDGGQRQFNIYFINDNIQGQRAFSCHDRGNKSSTLEPFSIDERKVTLDLLVSAVVLRLNSQKWLARN